MLQLTDDDVSRMKSLGREVCTHVAYSARRTESSRSPVRWTTIGFENHVELFTGQDLDDTNRTLAYMCGVTHLSATIDQVADLFNATDVDVPHVRDFYAEFHADWTHSQIVAPIRSRSRQYPRHMISLKTATMIDFKGGDDVSPQLGQTMMKRRIMSLQVLADYFASRPPPPHATSSSTNSPPSRVPSNNHNNHHVPQPPLGPSSYRKMQAPLPQQAGAPPHGGGYPSDEYTRHSRDLRHITASPSQQSDPPPSRYHDDASYQYGRQGSQPTQPVAPNSHHPFHMALPDQVQVSGSRLQASPRLQLLGDIHLKPKHAATQCACCVSGFNFLKKKHNCRVCGEVVCSSCCTQQRPVVPVEGIKKYHICTLCTMDSRRSVAASHPGLNNLQMTKSEPNNRSVLSGAGGMIRSPKSSLSGTQPPPRYKSPHGQPPAQDMRQGGTVRLRQPPPAPRPPYPDYDEMDLRLNNIMNPVHANMYSKPTMPQLQNYHPPSQQLHQAVAPLHNRPSHHHASGYPPSHHHHHQHQHQHHQPPPQHQQPPYNPTRPSTQPPPPSRGFRQHAPPTYENYGGGGASSMVSTNYPVPRYNGTNRPDDPRMSMLRDERESFLNLYDDVGTSVSRAQPVYRHPAPHNNPSMLSSRPVATQEVYIPPDAPTTTAVNLGDLRNAPDVLAALNQSRAGAGTGLRLEIISPHRTTQPALAEPESEPYGRSYPDHAATPPPVTGGYTQAKETTSSPKKPLFSTPRAEGAALVPPQHPGIYKGSRYRIKETRYYATSTDANPDEYVTQDRDSILVDMPSSAPPLMDAPSDPTALTVSRFLDHDIDMFLQPMENQPTTAATIPAAPLHQPPTPSAATRPNESGDVVALTQLLVDRLRMASDEERAVIRGALAAAVQ
ncbi:hypothetical protein B5M09_011414 [Aphanomyces astaci]|uniref:FYVE-type domain-containing protein n=2 Tax=Aphanomyces astaci TaxID=112090 RepID=A0A425CXY2_APHAT|nr:hypothetical protein B5M09_011414 [Aphanomyces astaci]